MSIFFCIFTLIIYPETSALEIITETSLTVWKFTPRYSIEPFPGYQVFLVNGLRCSYPVFSNNGISLGVEAGVASKFHLTYFHSYASWGLDDIDLWLMLDNSEAVNFLARIGLPTGSYEEGLGIGAYRMGLYARKANIVRNRSAYFGYEWTSTNPDKINYGDKIHLGLEICNWLCTTACYAFPDHGEYYSLYDSPSFAVEISIIKNFLLMGAYNMKLTFNQTLFGKDIPISSCISFRVSRRKGMKKPRETY